MKRKIYALGLFLLLYVPFIIGAGRIYEKINGVGVNLFGVGAVLPYAGFAAVCFAAGVAACLAPKYVFNRKTLLVALAVLAANYVHATMFLPQIEYAAGVPGCESGPDAERFADYNLLLISFDTLRADHLHNYGYGRETSPHNDSLAGRAVKFTRAYSAAPSTLPSHATMFTGLYPGAHTANFQLRRPLPGSAITLAETLRGAGYRTASFNGGGQLDSVFGLDQGFDVYNDEAGGFAAIWPRAKKWLDDNSDNSGRPFMLFLHSYDIHIPYDPPAPYSDMFMPEYDGAIRPPVDAALVDSINNGGRRISGPDAARIEALYDGGVRYADTWLGEIETYLRARDLADRTIIVALSDHGEEFMEHGYIAWHSHTLYDELLHVPLVIFIPGAGGKNIDARIGLVDLFPTLLDILDLSLPAGSTNGRSFAAALLEEKACAAPGRPLLAEKEPGAGVKDTLAGAVKSIRTGRWKYTASLSESRLLRPAMFAAGSFVYISRELYDIEKDPAEQSNLVARNFRLSRALEKLLLRVEKDSLGAALEPETGKVKLEGGQRQRIKDLGYIN